MKTQAARLERGVRHAVFTIVLSTFVASCSTSDSDAPFGFSSVGPADLQAVDSDFKQPATSSAPAYSFDESDPALPDSVAAAPEANPAVPIETTATAEATEATATPVLVVSAQQDSDPRPGAVQMVDAAVESRSAPAPTTVPLPTAEQVAAITMDAEEQGSQDTEVDPTAEGAEATPPPQVAVVAQQPKKRGFLSSFFTTQVRGAKSPDPVRPLIQTERLSQKQVASAAPLTQIVSTRPVPDEPLVDRGSAEGGDALPGVRQNALFEIKRRSGLDDDSDIDLHEGEEDLYQVASAAGLARLAPNGLLKQTEHVDVACLKPSLVRVLKTIEQHYGRKVVVTSGYRNADRNRKARGARNSLHMYCAAADVQVEGVAKWDLAAYVRSMPGRGGVGTYCHTNSVHIDVGPERDWNWRCRRRK